MSDLSFDDLAEMKIGDVTYECEAGVNIRARLTSEPVIGAGHEGRRTLAWSAVNTENGAPIDYLLTEGLEHYGPRLYRQPQYGYFRDGEFVTPLFGAAA